MVFTRKLGRSGIAVSALGMGCWAIGGPFWEDCAGLAVGTQRADAAHPGLPHSSTGGGELRRNAIWSADR